METRYTPIEALRTAIYGEILLCVDTHTQDEVVIKTVDLALANKRTSRTRELVHEDVRTEVDVLAQVRALGGHPNVIALRDYFVSADEHTLYVVLDYCDGGDLLDACSPPRLDQVVPSAIATDAAASPQSQRMPEYQALGYMRDVLSGLRFLHAHGIAHRDLSLENILLKHGRAVIADFGLCAQQQLSTSECDTNNSEFVCAEIVGKHFYMAPEVVRKQAYDPRVADIWSLGVALFILVTSSPPFEMASAQDAGFRFVAKHGVRAVLKAWGLASAISDASQDVLERMLQVDPALRIAMDDLVRHPAITGFPTSPVSASDAL